MFLVCMFDSWVNIYYIMSFEMAIQMLVIFLCILFLGMAGVFMSWHNLLFTMFSIEMVNISALMILTMLASLICDPQGYMIANVILWLTASESALSLGMLVVLFKFGGSMSYNAYSNLEG